MTPESSALVRVVSVAVVITSVVTAAAILRVVGPGAAPSTPNVSPLALSALAQSTPTPAVAETAPAAAPPQWIWSQADAQPGQRWFRRALAFTAPVVRATFTVSCDNRADVFIDGQRVGGTTDWQRAETIDLSGALAGLQRATLTIAAMNEAGPAGLIALLEVQLADGARIRIVSDAAWSVAANDAFESAHAAVGLGAHGAEPWGIIEGLPVPDIDRSLTAPDGFTVELVYRVPAAQGSWVSLAVDDAGRLIASPQSGGLYRIDHLQEPVPRVQALEAPVGSSQGLLCVGDDLYVMVNDDRADGPGLYRGRDTNGDGHYDAWRRLRAIKGGGEHGPHGLALGPDGMIYVVAGNHTPLPDPERFTVPPVWDEDTLLPRLWDARGHAVGIMAPGGWVCRTDRDGETWEVVATGFRNPYDLAFNPDGELFTYDADMEWDMGAPWYRPTRINHVVSGAEFGWRSGSAKWPEHYPDSLPAVADIGPGSPTGVLFGTGARFPARYQRALFALDWTFGTIYAVHLEDRGASYRGSIETFVTGRPLPVADAVINPLDGAMYFVVGGRGTQSALFRVRADDTPPAMVSNLAGGDEGSAHSMRARRRELERLHRPAHSADDIDAIWRGLLHQDRFVRFAARVALENQPIGAWIDRLGVVDRRPPLEAVLAAARVGTTSHRDRLETALLALDFGTLEPRDRVAWLRAWTVICSRMGPPPAATAERLRRQLEAVYPAGDPETDQDSCDLLVYLGSPRVVARTIPLMEMSDDNDRPPLDATLLARSASYGNVITRMIATPPQTQPIHYALALRTARAGWTPVLRERYFEWFEAMRHTSGGLSFAGFLDNIRDEALEQVPAEDRPHLAALARGTAATPADRPQPAGPPRLWTTKEVLALTAGSLRRRDWERRRRMYEAARCHECHRFAGTGRGGTGPDLTAVSTRFSLPDLVQALVEPSATISDQYEQTEVLLVDDSIVVGRIVRETETEVTVLPSPLAPDDVRVIPKRSIRDRVPSRVSPMMPGLLNPLGPEEVLDLLAYLLAEGDPRSVYFADN